MGVQIVSVVSGSETLIGEGINSAMRCLVRLPDTSVRGAIVKQLPVEGVAAEVFAALLLRGWGLTVPEPAIVENPMSFASMDAGYPNMKQHIGWNATFSDTVKASLRHRAAELVSQFAETPRALAADEAIQNRDRNLGNILWDGQNVCWIDHEGAFGLTTLPDLNKLAVMAQMSSNLEAVRSAAVTFAKGLTVQSVDEARKECGDEISADVFASNVAAKLQQLALAILSRFPYPGLFPVVPMP